MVKISLIVLGIIFLIATFFVLQVWITPDAKSDIRTANSLCTAEINAWGVKVPVGSWGQKLLGAEEDCRQIYYMMLLINYGFIGYLVGGLFLILGLTLGGGNVERRIKRDKRGSFCGDCGNELEGHEKHCPECGEEV